MSNRYIIYNGTDNITATPDTYTSKKKCNEVIVALRDRYKQQGYYRDNRMQKVAIEDIDYRIVKLEKGDSHLSANVREFSNR